MKYTETRQKALAIKEMAPEERPRERLLAKGAEALSDSELLAILIGSGTPQMSAFDMGRYMLEKWGSLAELSSRSVREFTAVRGMAEAKAVKLAAAFELVRRVQAADYRNKVALTSPTSCARYFVPLLRGLRKEQFHIALFNTAQRLIRTELVSEGILNASLVHPREVFRPAIIESCSSIIGIHNHPSGNPEPSNEDLALTRQLIEAGRMLGIPFNDHIIIAGETWTSLREKRADLFAR